ncbi:MAG TPA: hypothetical protein VI958_12050 [Acidobacteriota bacterium]
MRRFFLLAFLLIPLSVASAGGWSAEGFLGGAHSFSSDIKIKQDGSPDLAFSADYETKSFEGPLYYALRAGRWDGNGGWEAEWIHLKVFVTDLPPEVQRFSVSHGYNLLMLNRGWKFGAFFLRAGGGIVFAHPETVIRGVVSEQGYELTGPCGQFAAGRRFYFNKGVFVAAEGKFTIARAKITIANGEASAPNMSLHGLFGLGFQID